MLVEPSPEAFSRAYERGEAQVQRVARHARQPRHRGNLAAALRDHAVPRRLGTQRQHLLQHAGHAPQPLPGGGQLLAAGHAGLEDLVVEADPLPGVDFGRGLAGDLQCAGILIELHMSPEFREGKRKTEVSKCRQRTVDVG